MTAPQTSSAIGVRRSGSATIVEFLDRRLVDQMLLERVGAQLNELVDGETNPMLVLSFSKVEFMSSAALGILIALEARLATQGGKLALAEIDPELLKLFTLTKLHKVMKIHKTTQAALDSLKN
jgi:anti-sigma B factor antagonist